MFVTNLGKSSVSESFRRGFTHELRLHQMWRRRLCCRSVYFQDKRTISIHRRRRKDAAETHWVHLELIIWSKCSIFLRWLCGDSRGTKHTDNTSLQLIRARAQRSRSYLFLRNTKHCLWPWYTASILHWFVIFKVTNFTQSKMWRVPAAACR